MMNITTLKDLTDFQRDEKRFIQSLIENGLLQPLGTCSKCRRDRVLIKNKDYKGNYAARCPRCKKFTSLAKGTFFENTHLSVETIVQLIFCWAMEMPQEVTVNFTNVNRWVWFIYVTIANPQKILQCVIIFQEVNQPILQIYQGYNILENNPRRRIVHPWWSRTCHSNRWECHKQEEIQPWEESENSVGVGDLWQSNKERNHPFCCKKRCCDSYSSHQSSCEGGFNHLDRSVESICKTSLLLWASVSVLNV